MFFCDQKSARGIFLLSGSKQRRLFDIRYLLVTFAENGQVTRSKPLPLIKQTTLSILLISELGISVINRQTLAADPNPTDVTRRTNSF